MVNRDKLFQDGCREVEFGAPVSVGDEFNATYVTFIATAGAISSFFTTIERVQVGIKFEPLMPTITDWRFCTTRD